MATETLLIALSGELSAKGRPTRRHFTDLLGRNLQAALRGHGFRVRLGRGWSRLTLEVECPAKSPAGVEAAFADPLEVAARVFGVQSAARAMPRPYASLDDLLRDGLELFAPRVRGRSFAVRVKRGETASRQSFTSPEAERRLGALLAPFAARVDLENPDFEARIELHKDVAYYFADRRAGAGGLPVGSAGRGLLLFSGGFDSAVAAHQLLGRGLRLDYFLANLGDRRHLAQVAAVAGVLAERWSHGARPRLHVVDLRPWVAELESRCPPALWQVLLKRAMVRAAAAVARRHHLPALASGEVLAQVSSQTLPNLAVIERASDLPLLRPLLARDKASIIAEAGVIGTAELSARVPELCALDARAPSTHARPAEVAAAEALLDPGLLDGLVAAREVLALPWAPGPADGEPSESWALEELPPGARLYDLRERREPPLPGADALPFAAAWRLIEDGRLPGDDPARPLVLACERGMRSAFLAERLRARGHRAGWLRASAAAGDPLVRLALSPALLGEPTR